jgi:hypothetical protein
MWDGAASLSLVDAVLTEAVSGFRGLVRLEAAGADGGGAGTGCWRMTFTGETWEGRQVLVAAEARRVSGGDGRAAAADCGGRECDGEEAAANRRSGLADSDAYAIQFLDCDCPPGERGPGCEVNSGGRDEFFGSGNETRVVRVCLWRLNICFPVADEVALGWKPIEWWYYVLKFSPLFTAEELGRCQRLGMPGGVTSGMRRLREKRGTDEEELEEDSEISKILHSEAEQRGRLRVLMTLFLIASPSGEVAVGTDVKPFRIWFVRSVWDVLRRTDKTEPLYDAFLGFLRRKKLLIE